MRFVSRSVVTGFVNALAILIFLAQLPELTNADLARLCHDRGRAWASSICFPMSPGRCLRRW
jgi:MFS superfamily sulfate permease-like transporter